MNAEICEASSSTEPISVDGLANLPELLSAHTVESWSTTNTELSTQTSTTSWRQTYPVKFEHPPSSGCGNDVRDSASDGREEDPENPTLGTILVNTLKYFAFNGGFLWKFVLHPLCSYLLGFFIVFRLPAVTVKLSGNRAVAGTTCWVLDWIGFFIQSLVGLYQLTRMIADCIILVTVTVCRKTYMGYKNLHAQIIGPPVRRRKYQLLAEIGKAQTYEEWYALNVELDCCTLYPVCYNNEDALVAAESPTISRPRRRRSHLVSSSEDVEAVAEWRERLDTDLYDWRSLQAFLDDLCDVMLELGITPGVGKTSEEGQIRQPLENLSEYEARMELFHLLRSSVNRNFCHMRNPLLYGYSQIGTKRQIERFHEEVAKTIQWLPTPPAQKLVKVRLLLEKGTSCQPEKAVRLVAEAKEEVRELQELVQSLRRSYGVTALSLSGGGRLAAAHFGVVKALAERGCVPSVVSGSSGGSLLACCMGLMGQEALLSQIIMRTDEMEDFATLYRMLPSVREQLLNYLTRGYCVEPAPISQNLRKAYGDITFAEAYAITGQEVSVTVSPATQADSYEPLTCNHITTPDVLLWSAILASCSLPGILPPTNLYMKKSTKSRHRSDGEVYPSEYQTVAFRSRVCSVSRGPHGLPLGAPLRRDDGSPRTAESVAEMSQASLSPATARIVRYNQQHQLWADGSIRNDIPCTELRTAFNVKEIVASQVNPHMAAFVSSVHHEVQNSSTYLGQIALMLESYLAHDLRDRYQKIVMLMLVPHFKGIDISPFLFQNAEGTITITPARKRTYHSMIQNASDEYLDECIMYGQRRTWPHLARIALQYEIEKALVQTAAALEEQMQEIHELQGILSKT